MNVGRVSNTIFQAATAECLRPRITRKKLFVCCSFWCCYAGKSSVSSLPQLLKHGPTTETIRVSSQCLPDWHFAMLCDLQECYLQWCLPNWHLAVWCVIYRSTIYSAYDYCQALFAYTDSWCHDSIDVLIMLKLLLQLFNSFWTGYLKVSGNI